MCGEIGVFQRNERHQRPSGGQKRNTLPTAAAHQARHKDGDCFTLCQAFPGLTMEKLKSGFFGRSSDLSAHQRSKVQKLNERSGTGSVEGICSGSEEFFLTTIRPETTLNLSCQRHSG